MLRPGDWPLFMSPLPELSESELLRAMFDVGYFPPNTTPTVAADYDI